MNNIYPGKEEDYLTVGGQFEGFQANITVDAAFGDNICETTGPITEGEMSGQESNIMDNNKILSVKNNSDNVFVFVAK
jgi:hypothetical protein